MARMFSNNPIDRRSALATLGAAGLGLLAMPWSPIFAADLKDEEFAKLLSHLTGKSRAQLLRLLQSPGFSGHIPAPDAASLAENEHKTVDALMVDLLPLARTYARSPISNYLVGAIVRGVSGNLYLGANIEIPGHSLGSSVHGEQFALSNAYMHAEQGISALAVTAAPCGHCRQFINEMAPAGDTQVVIAGKAPVRLDALLPSAFGPRDLGFKDGALPVKTINLARPKGDSDALTLAAQEAARKSYAPYSKAHSGIAIGTPSGRIYSGAYIENVAFNPSLSPLQTALAALIVAGENYAAISKVALVEMEGAAISQKSVTEAVLSAIAPSASLQITAVALTV
jgi:cytidine deaminase